MIQLSLDLDGNEWDIAWGTSDPEEVFETHFKIDSSKLIARPDRVSFGDPQHALETKTLRCFTAQSANNPVIAAMAEITPGIYAVGVKRGK